jgi:hypothetical protein
MEAYDVYLNRLRDSIKVSRQWDTLSCGVYKTYVFPLLMIQRYILKHKIMPLSAPGDDDHKLDIGLFSSLSIAPAFYFKDRSNFKVCNISILMLVEHSRIKQISEEIQDHLCNCYFHI